MPLFDRLSGFLAEHRPHRLAAIGAAMMIAWATTASAPAAPNAALPVIDAMLLSAGGSGDVLTYNDQALATAGDAEVARVLVPIDRSAKIDGTAPDRGSIA